jgi:hypothetical protein
LLGSRRLRLLGCASLALRLPRREPPPSGSLGRLLTPRGHVGGAGAPRMRASPL